MQLDNLIEGFKNKDIAAFEKLYAMYSKNICGVINTIVKNEGRAQEICQDVFVKVWNNAENYNASKGRFFTWVLNIARNAAIDEIRSTSYRNEKKNLSATFFVGILEEPADDGERIDTNRLKKLIHNLKDKCVQLIELLYFRGYSQKEAADELNIPVGTIKTRNRSCISQLRETIEAK